MPSIQAQAIVTDIEGTTTDIAFVHRVLFPYARHALPDFVRKHQADQQVAAELKATAELADQSDASVDQIITILLAWIDEDRKATPLKNLQGLIWRAGYENGDFRGHVYDDAYTGLKRWKQQGVDLSVYSSGSIAAQQLLFGHAEPGDMRPLFSHWFDTTTGPKKQAQSYQLIAKALHRQAQDILFLSDVVDELDAAHAAGMQTLQLCRETGMNTGQHPIVSNFDEIIITP